MKAAPLSLALVLFLLNAEQPPLTYRFVEVKSTVTVTHAGVPRRATVGDLGLPGDGVRTGWRGRAVLEVPTHAARFELLPATEVELAGPTPGVLLHLQRGRLKAFFDALSGVDPRIVATPGALLGVRGTRYAVEVGEDGGAALAVFEGAVEVQPADPRFPSARVGAGELCRYGPRQAPQRQPLPPGLTVEKWRGGLDVRGTAGARRPPQEGPSAPPHAPPSASERGKRGGAGRGGGG